MFTDPREITEVRYWLAAQILTSPPDVAPGEYLYSNGGYVIVGSVMESVTGDSWETLLTDRIFAPLQMDSCGFGSPATPGLVDQPWGHLEQGASLTPVESGLYADNPPAFGPAGTVHCAARDWAKFVSLHILGANGITSILSAPSFTRLHTAWPGGDYALGWGSEERDWAGGLCLSHAGSNTMWLAQVVIAPVKNRGFIVTMNRYGDPALNGMGEVVGAIIDAYFLE